MASESAPGLQELLGAAGACPVVHHAGVAWTVGHPTQRAKAVLEELCAARAVREVVALKGALPPAEYAELFQETTHQIAAGDYRTWGVGWSRLVTCRDGPTLFLQSLLRQHHPAVTEADAASLIAHAGDEIGAALARVVPGFFALLAEPLAVPPEKKARIVADMADALRGLMTPTTAG